MRLISFIFILILPFILHVCNSTSKQSILKQLYILKIKVGLEDIHPSKYFRKNCEREVKSNMKRGFHGVHPSSYECMMYCGFKKYGKIFANGTLNYKFVGDKMGGFKRRPEAMKRIQKCESKNNGLDICRKAMKNAECTFEYLPDIENASEWLVGDLRYLMESS